MDAVISLRSVTKSFGAHPVLPDISFDIPRGQITAVMVRPTGFAKDIYVSELGDADAQAIVVLDVEVDGVAGPRTQRDLYVRLTPVEVDGERKVDQVTDLSFDPGAGTSTTAGAPESTTTSI